MSVLFKSIDTPSHPFFDEAMRIYEASFPDNERQPIHKIRSRILSGRSSLYVAVMNDTVTSMCLLWDIVGSGFILLDYLAVHEKYRGRHMGSDFFQFLLHAVESTGKYLLIEAEDPEYGNNPDERIKRINFYLLNGAYLLSNVPYILPALDGTVPTKMNLLIAPEYKERILTGTEVAMIITRLYTEVYEKSIDDEELLSLLNLVPAVVNFSNTMLK